MSDSTPLLVARDIGKVFRTEAQELEVFRDLNLTLHRGETAALLGVSGSGKSTLLQILGSLDRPTSGEVLLNGRNVFKLPERERARLRNRGISFVYQSHRLLPEFTALENVMMPLLIGRAAIKAAREQGTALLEEVGLGKRLGHKPGQLSGGEQQRVAIARAVVTQPELLLADEPTGNLDPHTAQEVFGLLQRLNRQHGLTMLMVTHNPELAQEMDRRFHLVDGQLVEDTPGRRDGATG